jgi:uncharacterized protein YceH (UPF0502 family)
MALEAIQGRVLGCLVEKELATPQQYPLTASALVAACNQSSNRDPVMTLAEDQVLVALDALKAARLVRFVLPSHGRSVVRYRHVLDEHLGLDVPERAVLAVLLLRGPQTSGELRARTERLADLATVADVEVSLQALAARAEPLAQRLARQPGHKEPRWQQLLADEARGRWGSMPADAWGASAPTATNEPPLPAIRGSSSPTGSATPSAAPGPAGQGGSPGSTGWGGPDGTLAAPGSTGPSGNDLAATVAGLAAELRDVRDAVDDLRRQLASLREALGD